MGHESCCLAPHVVPTEPSAIGQPTYVASAVVGASAFNGATNVQILPVLAMPCIDDGNMDPLSKAPRTHATISLDVETRSIGAVTYQYG